MIDLSYSEFPLTIKQNASCIADVSATCLCK